MLVDLKSSIIINNILIILIISMFIVHNQQFI